MVTPEHLRHLSGLTELKTMHLQRLPACVIKGEGGHGIPGARSGCHLTHFKNFVVIRGELIMLCAVCVRLTLLGIYFNR